MVYLLSSYMATTCGVNLIVSTWPGWQNPPANITPAEDLYPAELLKDRINLPDFGPAYEKQLKNNPDAMETIRTFAWIDRKLCRDVAIVTTRAQKPILEKLLRENKAQIVDMIDAVPSL